MVHGHPNIYISTVKAGKCSCDNMGSKHNITPQSGGTYTCQYCCQVFVPIETITKLQQELETLRPRTPQEYVPLQWKD